MDFFEQNKIPIMVFGAIMVLWAVWMVFYMKKRKQQEGDFLRKYPNAAKLYLTKGAIATNAVQVHTVDNEMPAFFTDGGKSGVYLKPGSNILEVSYTWSRPGVMYKTVTKSTGPMKQEVDIEPQQNYFISYNKKEERFVFEEITQ